MDDAGESSYILRLLIAVDQLGNTIFGGNPDSTISARTGYFANDIKAPPKLKWWWKWMERIIDWAFLPIDGPQHCLKAYKKDQDEQFLLGTDIGRGLMGIIIIPCCFFICVFNWLLVMFFPSIRYQKSNRENKS